MQIDRDDSIRRSDVDHRECRTPRKLFRAGLGAGQDGSQAKDVPGKLI